MKRDGEVADTLLREAERLGVAAQLENSGHHKVVVLSHAGQKRRYFFASSMSDWRARKNAISGLRRVVRELTTA